MASKEEIQKLRLRIGRLLKSDACLQIQFMLANVCIQRFMYTYIGQAILEDTVHLDIGNNPGYDHKTKTFTVEADASDATIVHEATHIVINATHVGKTITKGTHETAAYLAEALWALNSGNDISINVPHVDIQVGRLARKIRAYYARKNAGMYVCDPADYMYIQALLKNSRLNMDIDHTEVQVGIGDGPT